MKLPRDSTTKKNQPLPRATESIQAILSPKTDLEMPFVRQMTPPSESTPKASGLMYEAAKFRQSSSSLASKNDSKILPDPNKKVEVLSAVILPEKTIDIKNYLSKNVQQNFTEIIASKKPLMSPPINEEADQSNVSLGSIEGDPMDLQKEAALPKQPASIFSTFTHASSYSHVASTSMPASPMIWSTQRQPEINSNQRQIYLTPPIPSLERPIVYHNFTAHTPNPKPLVISLPPDQKRATIYLAKPAGYIHNNQFVRNLPKPPTKVPLQQTILASTDKAVPSIVIDRSFVENDGLASPMEKEPPEVVDR
jgi:hypothetical protein